MTTLRYNTGLILVKVTRRLTINKITGIRFVITYMTKCIR